MQRLAPLGAVILVLVVAAAVMLAPGVRSTRGELGHDVVRATESRAVVAESRPGLELACSAPARAPVPQQDEPSARMKVAPNGPALSRPTAMACGRVIQLFKRYDGVAPSFEWVTDDDAHAIDMIANEWTPKIRDARVAIQTASIAPHMAKIDRGDVEVYPIDGPGEHSIMSTIEKPRHPGQIVWVAQITDQTTRIATYRVTRFEPGEDPGIDAAQAALAEVRRQLRAEIDRVRAGR